MSQPPWSEAVTKARQSIPTLRELFPSHRGSIGVKYPLLTNRGEKEHVWGELLELGQESFVTGLDTPLRRGAIRGGYTTRLDIKLARESGQPVPDHMQEMDSRFVDA